MLHLGADLPRLVRFRLHGHTANFRPTYRLYGGCDVCVKPQVHSDCDNYLQHRKTKPAMRILLIEDDPAAAD